MEKIEILSSTRYMAAALLASLLVVLTWYGQGHAVGVSGQCGGCHTMHDSQNALTMRLDSTPVTGSGSSECYDCHAQLRPTLMRMDCLGCHAQGWALTTNIIDSTPQVVHSDANDLAGGNFKYVFGDDTYGHNVHGFPSGWIGTDSNLGNTPPGYDSAFDPSTGKYTPAYASGNIMCAGQNGCHGDREEVSQMQAIKGAHHTDDTVLQYGAGFTTASQGTTVGNSYRFLYKVKGAEDGDWQDTVGGTDHNEYFGTTFDGARASQAWADITTMSQFCAECHGAFHSGGGQQSAAGIWIRHPSDAVMPNTGPYSSYVTYDTDVPVARQSITAGATQASSTVSPGTDVVFCLSCHVAHASQYSDALRWDYDTCSGGDVNCGCYVCHSDKN